MINAENKSLKEKCNRYEKAIDEMAAVIGEASGLISDLGGTGCDICPLYYTDKCISTDTCNENIADYYKNNGKL